MNRKKQQLSYWLKLVGVLSVICMATGCLTDEFKSIEITGISLINSNDGRYEGVYETSLVKATVQVVIQDHRIKDIQITRHENGMGKKAEKIIARVIEKQTTNVDAISGATASSRVILKAIENAVSKAETQKGEIK